MSEEAKDKKLTKKKTSSKKSLKDEAKPKEAKKKTPSHKSSHSGSKKGESPAASRDELPSENPLTEKDNKEMENPPEQITPNFPPRTNLLPPQPQGAYPDYQPVPRPGYPAYSGYPSVQVPQAPQVPKQPPVRLCVHHNQPLKFYCEACEEPTCEDCHTLGPHNTELHRVSSLQEAFNARYSYLSGGTYKTLLEKRDKLLAQLDKVDYRIGEIRSVSSIIERDVKTEYAGMLERLKSAEGVKQAVLQHDMAEIQKDIERIDSIFDSLDEYLQGDSRGDFVGFLIKFRELHEYIEYAITKPFKARIDVVPNDMPRELTEKRKMLERAEQSEGLLKLKDEIIWNLIQEKKKLTKMAEIDLDKAVQQEWNEWARLIEKYCEELLKYQLVCSYCGCALDDLTVNSSCPANLPSAEPLSGTQSRPGDSKHTVDEPPMESKGTGRHFFAKPVKQTMNQPFMARVMVDPRALTAFNAIRDGGKEKQTELRRRLDAQDREGKQEIDAAEFKGTIASIYGLEEEIVSQLMAALTTPGTKRVSYQALLQHLEGQFDREPKHVHSLRYARDESAAAPTSTRIVSGTNVLMVVKDETLQRFAANVRKKGMTKQDLQRRFEGFDKAGKGAVTLDSFYLALMKMDFVVSNQDIEALAKLVSPEAERTNEINYNDFINKVL